jgi:DNA invertase Pin-like site-specific DNA recombinase
MTAAKYIRLSSADEDVKYGDKAESNSVINQRNLLDGYIRNHSEFSDCTVMEFLDDGHSGTNLNRPGMRALLEAARRREIDCVIVKDLSRFARDYLTSGHYLEQVFPALGIRFISINDGYDSNDFPYGTAGNITNGLLSLINEMYSRDLSQKSKAAKRLYAQRGQCISAYPVYGYLKSPEDKRAWIPDPEAAPVVQRMFNWYVEGLTPTEIARRLNEDGIPTPAQHKRALGSKRQLWNSERTNNFWRATTIDKILQDERYTGKLVALKTTLSELGNIRSAKPIERDGWIVIPGAFEAIISQELFDLAQTRKRRPFRKIGPMKQYLFSRKLKCGHCGAALQRHEISQGVYYACDGRAWNGTNDCKKIRLFEADLIQAVLASIRFQAQLAKRTEKRLDRQAKKIQAAQDRTMSAQQRIQRRIAQLEIQKAETYLSFDLGEISQVHYREQCIKLGAAITEQHKKLEMLNQSKDSDSSCVDMVSYGQINGLKQLTDLRTLDRKMVETLIHSVQVYSGNRIEISWNFNEDDMRLIAEEDITMRGSN